MEKEPVLTVDKPKFVVRLHEDILEVDLKEGALGTILLVF